MAAPAIFTDAIAKRGTLSTAKMAISDKRKHSAEKHSVDRARKAERHGKQNGKESRAKERKNCRGQNGDE